MSDGAFLIVLAVMLLAVLAISLLLAALIASA